MRAGWTISSNPATHAQSNLQQYFVSTQSTPTKIPEDYVANDFSVKPILPPTKSTSYFNKTKSNHPLPTVSV